MTDQSSTADHALSSLLSFLSSLLAAADANAAAAAAAADANAAAAACGSPDPTRHVKLSPAAQAVLDAANSRNSYGPDDCLNESREIAAAALRAAVNEAFLMVDNAYAPGTIPLLTAAISRDRLLAIATELAESAK